MNKTLALLLAASCLTAVGQVEISYPYNPDNGDGAIGSPDLIELLTLYGTLFEPEALMVNEIPFQDWVDSVNNTLLSQQATIDSLMLNNSSTSLSEFIPCEPSDFYVVVSDTIWPSELGCYCTTSVPSACTDEYGALLENFSLDDFMDEAFVDGSPYNGGRISHVITFHETCNSIDFQRFDEVFSELDLFQTESYENNLVEGFEQVFFTLPNLEDGSYLETKGQVPWFPQLSMEGVISESYDNFGPLPGCGFVTHQVIDQPTFLHVLFVGDNFSGPSAPSIVYRRTAHFINGIWNVIN